MRLLALPVLAEPAKRDQLDPGASWNCSLYVRSRQVSPAASQMTRRPAPSGVSTIHGICRPFLSLDSGSRKRATTVLPAFSCSTG